MVLPRTKTLIFCLLAALCLVAAVRSADRGQGALVLRIGILAGPADEDYDGALAFKAHVEAASRGALAVEIYPSGQFCGSERECLEHLDRGLLAAFIAAPGGLGTAFPPIQILDLPYALAGDAEAECVVDGPFLELLRAEMAAAGLGYRLMAVGNTGGWRNFATVRRPVHRPEDLTGLKLRTTSAPAQQALTRMMGASPTPVPWSEAYTALATGVVSGTKNGIRDIMSARFDDHLRYVTLDGHSYMSALWLMSERVWQRLSPDQQAIVAEGFLLLRDVTRRTVADGEAAAYARFKASGGQVIALSPEQKQAFVEAAAGMRAWFERRLGPRWLDRLDRAVAACRPPPASTP